jgi:hypothetical protein
MEQETSTKTVSLPLMCDEGHQMYIMFLPQVDRFGFGCGMCHKFGSTITHGPRVLEVQEVTSSKGPTKDFREDLMLGMETKAVHQCCPKGHYVMAFEFTQGFGFGCIHCKIYTLAFMHNERLYEIRVVRELDNNDPKVKALPRRAVVEHPSFTIQ